ncbi:MAG: class II glutamine amidotransferase [Hydrogenophilaceae bacterium]
MCELFGLSASRPLAGRELPLAEFRARGGGAADNPDGWGLAWREGGDLRLEKEPLPASASTRFDTLTGSLCSDLVVGHVRKARFPPINTLENTHPFLRECCGRGWVFAHNGLVPEIVALESASASRVCRPEGETDSEFAFCHLLSHVTRHLQDAGADWPARLGAVSEVIARHGKFNFLLSDGEHLIAYGHDRLHCLETHDGPDDVVLVATEPLSGQPGWTAFAPGELRIWRAGTRVGRLLTHPPVPNA